MLPRISGVGSSSWARLICWVLMAGVWLGAQPLASQNTADLVFHNGKVVTVDEGFSIAQAVAVTGNQFTAVGSNQDVLRLAGPNTRVIDLKGRTVIPGLVDSHRHMYSYAERAYGGDLDPHQWRRYPIDWRGVFSAEDVLNQIRATMEKYQFPPGQWVYFANRFSGGITTEQARLLYDGLDQWVLDQAAPDNPIAMSLGIPDFNGFLVNKYAMDMLMKEYGDFMRRNGRLWVDSQGRPDGHLEPPASRLVLPFTYDRKPEDLGPIYKKDLEEMASMGITTVVSRLPKDAKAAYEWLRARGELTVRIGGGAVEEFGTTPVEEMASLKSIVGSGDDMMWWTGVGPTAIDGSGSRACTDQKRVGGAYGAIDEWFPMGQCHNDIEYRGSPKRAAPIQENYYRNWTFGSAEHGIRFANVHVAGDRGVGVLLNIIEEIQKQYGADSTKGWAMDHCDMVNPADFSRLARFNVMLSCYIRLNRLANMANSYGETVANTFHAPVKSMLDAGVKVVFETDSGVYIWDHMEDFVVRKDSKGKVWGPQDRVDHVTLLKMATIWSAEYALKADKLGSIEPGKLADMLILDRDYLTIPSEQISEVTPQLTLLDGKIIFLHPDFSREYNLRPQGALIATFPELFDRRIDRRGGPEAQGGGGI